MAILCSLCSIAVAQQSVKQKVAVYVTGDVENGYKKVIGSKLVTGVTRSEGYTAVERTVDFLTELNKEQDYQMSGAVNDRQIARIGQQFGVRFVLVADISEVFESLFISARMIDVQTAQITSSTESNSNVDNIEGLNKLAEEIVWQIIKTPEDPDAIKMHNITCFDDFSKVSCPEGYHMATYDEILNMIDKKHSSSRNLRFPIYLNLQYTEIQKSRSYWRELIDNNTGQGKHYFTANYIIRKATCNMILGINCDFKHIALEYTDDIDATPENTRTIYNGDYRIITSLTYIGTPVPEVTPGFIYFIKNKQ